VGWGGLLVQATVQRFANVAAANRHASPTTTEIADILARTGSVIHEYVERILQDVA
jgi:hypothetical protein